MKKLFFMALTAAFAFTSCNDNEEVTGTDSGNTSFLSIETEINTQQSALRSSGPVSAFPENSRLGLWVTPGTLGTNYPTGPYNNVLAEYTSGKWQLTPQVKLSDISATIYAFYPYNSDHKDGISNMHVFHTNQVDYMYGTNAEGQESIDRNNSNVRLRMKHALALLQFRIKKMNYPGDAKLTRVEVYNNTGKYDMYSAASINIATGELNNVGGNHSSAYVENISDGLISLSETQPTEEKDLVNLLVLPVASTSTHGSIVLKFIVDDTVYLSYVPINTTWKQGTKYIYDVTLNGTELVIDDVIITDWIDGPVNSVELF